MTLSNSTSSDTVSNSRTLQTRTITNQTAGSVFEPSASVPIGGSSAASAIADFNNDGHQDAVLPLVGTALTNNIIVLLGSGAGSFSTTTSSAGIGSDPFAVVTGDFNGDGKADLATANRNSENLSVLLGNGDGTLQTATAVRAGSQPRSLVSGDFNGDNRLDLATVNYNSNTSKNTLSVLLGNGNGTFQTAKTTNLDGSVLLPLATGDLDKDGKLDLITADYITNTIYVLLGNGSGGFRDTTPYQIGGTAPAAIATGDFNGDNKLDIATANYGSGSQNISVLFGNGKGGFKSTIGVSIGGRSDSLAATDVNGDGDLDIVATNTDNGSVSVIYGDGGGQFSFVSNPAVGGQPTGVSTADFNEDGKPDLVLANATSTNASILLNRTSSIVLTPGSSNRAGKIDASKEATSSIKVDLAKNKFTIRSSPAKTSTLDGSYDTVLGTQLGDVITGNSDRNLLNGNAGNDVIKGLNGNDTLLGGDGDDRLVGGGGDDRLTGGLGQDKLKGNQGKDRFIFDTGAPFGEAIGVDRLLDFTHSQDKIVLDRSTFTAFRQKKIRFATVSSLDAAETSNALITYVRSSGKLFYNQNGAATGFGSGGVFAVINQPNAASHILTASDFSLQK
jgi:Ca2+-binding RTX toxin-like protein